MPSEPGEEELHQTGHQDQATLRHHGGSLFTYAREVRWMVGAFGTELILVFAGLTSKV